MFDEAEERVVREVFSEYTYLLILMKPWYRYWNINLESMNTRVDEYNGKYVVMVKVRAWKVRKFSSN